MGTDKELILSLCPAHGRFIANLVGLLGGELPLGERLPDLIAQSSALHLPSRFRLILAFHQQELDVGRGGIAEVSGHGPQLLRIEPIIKAVFQALQSRPARGLLVWFDECCGRGIPPFRTEKPAATRPPVMFGTLCPKGQASFSSLRRGPTVAGRTDVHILLSLGHHLVPACGDEQHENGCAPLQASGLMFAVQAGLFHLLIQIQHPTESQQGN